MYFEYVELKDEKLVSLLNRFVSENTITTDGGFYTSFSMYNQNDKRFFSVCSSEELKQEIKIRSKLKSSPVCRNNRLSSINQIITYADLSISDPDEETEIIHRQNNGYKSLVSLNISNENIKYSFNITSNLIFKDSKIIYHKNKIIVNKYFNEIKCIFDKIIQY